MTESRKIMWYEAADAPELGASGAMSPPDLPDEVAAGLGDSPLHAGNCARVLFRDTAPGGFSLVHAWFGEDFPLPRHTHSGDCLYYVLKGEVRMGSSKVVHAGDGFFVPSGRPYAYRAGPGGAEVLEFRAISSFDMKVLDRDVDRWNGFRETGEKMHDEWERTQPEWAKPLIAGFIAAMAAAAQV